MVQDYLQQYIKSQKDALDSIPHDKLHALISIFKGAVEEEKQIFVFGNGGSAANASHFVTDLGKSASDKIGKRFRCMSLNDNISWMTAIGNDYTYEDVFVRQLQNYARPGDLCMALSVSGRSPNVIKTLLWAKQNGLFTIALAGAEGKEIEKKADFSILINSKHYGRVEDAQMGICHMVCYAFVELKL